MEYILLITMILVAILLMQKYMAQSFQGRLRATGEGIGQGRQYSPTQTVAQCAFDSKYGVGWYDAECFYDTCHEPCFNIDRTDATCSGCMSGCKTGICDQ